MIGHIDQLPTPCLIVDIDAFDRNIAKLSAFAQGRGVALRPHAKTHKCVEVAKRQLAAGAAGICVATIAEAEVMVRAGISGILLTGEMVGEIKVRRLMEVVRQAPGLMAVVDDPRNVAELQDAASHAGLKLHVLVDLDVGARRTGAQPGAPALAVAEAIGQSKNLVMRGICAYAGHSAHVVGFDQRRRHSTESMNLALETRDAFLRAGHNVEILTGGSTGTYNIDSSIAGVTELQSGSYVFMDVDYRRIGGREGNVYLDFEPALFLLATVIHRSGNKAVIDAGLKAMATDRPFGPEVVGIDGVRHQFAGDEHSRLLLDSAERDIQLGERLRFIVPHCDPTVNLYSRLLAVRGDQVEAVWPIMERSGPACF